MVIPALALQAALLCKCVFEGKIDMLKSLLRAGANSNSIDYDKQTALHIAAADGNLPAVSAEGDV